MVKPEPFRPCERAFSHEAILTVLGVFTGLILFVVVIPVVLLTVAIAGKLVLKPATPRQCGAGTGPAGGISDQPSTNPFAAFGGSGLVGDTGGGRFGPGRGRRQRQGPADPSAGKAA
jgi:hypothetical protein